jgi:HK97 family phage portal protein
VFERFRELFNREKGSISYQHVAEVAPVSIVDYQSAYEQVDVIHRAIELTVNSLVEVPFQIEGTLVNKVDTLLNVRPNPWEDRVRLFRRAFLDFILDGNAFFYYEKATGDLYVLPANDITIVPDPKRFVAGYKYNPGAGVEASPWGKIEPKKSEKEIWFDRAEIIHVKGDSSDNMYRGESRLKSINTIIELYYHMISFQSQFFANNAVPGMVLETDNVLSPKNKNRLLEQWKDSYKGMFKGGRSPALLDGGIKINSFSTATFSELDFEKSIERIQEDMCVALGVPYVLLQSGNNANVSNTQTLFYLHTILPILESFSSAFTYRFGPGTFIRPDKQSISALRPDTRSEALYYSTLVNTGIITPNEAREGLRFECLDDCDEIRIPQNIAGSAVDASQGGAPPKE